MKIGYVFECGPDGGDMKVLRHLTLLIAPGAAFEYEALSVKTTLLRDCGKAVKRLLDSGCHKVFIVWDLYRRGGKIKANLAGMKIKKLL